MGRKNLATERIDQILNAFEQCIIKHRLEGATLQRTADLAEINLGMIHHYIGRKEELLKAMASRLITRTQQEMAQFIQSTSNSQRLPLLLTLFFDGDADENDKIVEALYSSGYENKTIRAALEEINRLYRSIWADEIGRLHPTQSTERCQEIALAVLGLVYGRELLPVDNQRPEMWRLAAETLINNP